MGEPLQGGCSTAGADFGGGLVDGHGEHCRRLDFLGVDGAECIPTARGEAFNKSFQAGDFLVCILNLPRDPVDHGGAEVGGVMHAGAR